MTIDAVQTVAAVATAVGAIGGFLVFFFFVYRKDRYKADRARQAEVHAHATQQWREIVRLAIDHEEVRPLVIRGVSPTSRQHFLYESVGVLMAYVQLIETRQEASTAGETWVKGWRALFVNMLGEETFVAFLRAQNPVYDKAMQDWVEGLIEDAAGNRAAIDARGADDAL